MQCGAAQPTEGFAGLGIGAVQYASEGQRILSTYIGYGLYY